MLIKLKANIPEIFLGVFLTVAVFAVGMAVESSRSPSASGNAQTANRGGSLQAPENATDKTTDWLLVVLNFFLVGSTLLLWKANNRSAKIAERALTDLERPYLFILDYNWLLIKEAEANGLKCGLIYSVANGGKLPAIIKGVKLGIQFGDAVPFAQNEPPVRDLLTAPLVEGGDRRRVIQAVSDEAADNGTIDPPFEYEIKGGLAFIPATAFKTGRVIVIISIEYDGAITTGHVTTTCWEWHPGKYAFTQYGGPEHNQRT
jgi:hypothetical protein